MSAFAKLIRVAVLGAAITASPVLLVTAQEEISQSHLAAAQLVVVNSPQLGDFNNILPRLANEAKDRLIRVRPELYREISAAVDTVALEVAARRSELNADFARVWARNFTEEELTAINDFFSSDVGVKYKENAGAVGRDLLQASTSWGKRVGDELFEKAVAELRSQGHEF